MPSGLRWTPGLFFPQDGDALARSATASFSLARTATVTAGIYQGSTLIRTIWMNRSLAAGSHGWAWDGRNAAGAFVPRGRYTLRVQATSALGTTVLTRTVVVDAFSVALSATWAWGSRLPGPAPCKCCCCGGVWARSCRPCTAVRFWGRPRVP